MVHGIEVTPHRSQRPLVAMARGSTRRSWLTPRPRKKRPSHTADSVRCPAAIAVASRAQMLAIPDATTSCSVADSSSDALANTSRRAVDPLEHRADERLGQAGPGGQRR